MPVGWRFRGPLLAVHTAGEDYTNAEIAQAIDEACAHPHFRPDTFVVFEGILFGPHLSVADVRWRVGFIASLPARGFNTSCVLVERGKSRLRDAVAREMARALEPLGVRLTVFSSEEQAVAWLTERRL